MKCPMKFADGSRRASQTECEREDCAWWVTDISKFGEWSACAMALLASGDPIGRRVVNGMSTELNGADTE